MLIEIYKLFPINSHLKMVVWEIRVFTSMSLVITLSAIKGPLNIFPLYSRLKNLLFRPFVLQVIYVSLKPFLICNPAKKRAYLVEIKLLVYLRKIFRFEFSSSQKPMNARVIFGYSFKWFSTQIAFVSTVRRLKPFILLQRKFTKIEAFQILSYRNSQSFQQFICFSMSLSSSHWI